MIDLLRRGEIDRNLPVLHTGAGRVLGQVLEAVDRRKKEGNIEDPDGEIMLKMTVRGIEVTGHEKMTMTPAAETTVINKSQGAMDRCRPSPTRSP